jgi:hypothetical protein
MVVVGLPIMNDGSWDKKNSLKNLGQSASEEHKLFGSEICQKAENKVSMVTWNM